ncbi:MAG: SGNH/GDSL hydrolase family protein [Limisphaerales bacterium]
MKNRLVLPHFAVLLAAPALFAASQLPPNARVAIIGDSITEQKLYSKYMEAYLLACTGRKDIHVMQFGWSGETAGGFAARCVNDLAAFAPNVATTCYGMNDGGYQPWKDSIGQGYEANMRNVLKQLAAAGVKHIVVGSPGAVDSKFFGVRASFGGKDSAAGYNDTLAHLRDIAQKLATENKLAFANVHNAMFDAMPKAKAALTENYPVCGGDGFHPGPNGQLLMAYAFLKGLGVDGDIGTLTVDLKGAATATDGHKVLSSGAGKVEFESTRWPFCFDADPKNANSTRSILPFAPFNQDLNRLTLKVKNLGAAKAKVTWGAASMEFTKEQLEAGVNLAAEFPATPFDASFAKLVDALGRKQNFETSMIKGLVTNFRNFASDAKADPELAKAFATVGTKLQARQQALDAEARATLGPVKHTLTVTAL